jgi:hypothetical protein
VKILTVDATCTAPLVLFRHELGHTLGIFRSSAGGLMSAPMAGSIASQREINMLVQLYRLRMVPASIPTAGGKSFSETVACAMVLHAKTERLLMIGIPRRWTAPSSRVTTVMGTPTAVG